jgi:DNA-binding transcriptional LysR family regulator
MIEIMHAIELRLYRKLAIEIVGAYSCELLDQLQHRQIDLALVTSPPQMAVMTTVQVASNLFMIACRETHPLAMKQFVTLTDIAEFPWVFFHRTVDPPLHDLVLQRMDKEGRKLNVRHRICQADHAAALLSDNKILAWLTPSGSKRVVGEGFVCIPLHDEEIRLNTYIAVLASNESRLVSEYVRTLVKRIEDQRAPAQLQLPIG